MIKQYFVINSDGVYIEPIILTEQERANRTDVVEIQPPCNPSFYKARWISEPGTVNDGTSGKWVEGATEEEIKASSMEYSSL